jgi:hypothetical protein
MPIVRFSPHWVSLYGVVLELPPEWTNATDYCFVPEGEGKRRFIWDELLFDETAALSWLEEKRALMVSLKIPAEDISPVTRLYHPHCPTYGFLTRMGEGADQVDLGLFAVVRPHNTLTLSTRGSPHLSARLPDLLASTAPWYVGHRLPELRHHVFDTSFAWQGPLAEPGRFRFEAPDWDATLQAAWLDGRVRNEEPDWQALFTLEPGATIEVTQRDLRVVQGGQLQVPFAASHQKLIWQEARWFALARGEKGERRFVFCEAQAQMGARHLNLQFRSSLPAEHLLLWNRIIETVVVEI